MEIWINAVTKTRHKSTQGSVPKLQQGKTDSGNFTESKERNKENKEIFIFEAINVFHVFMSLHSLSASIKPDGKHSLEFPSWD